MRQRYVFSDQTSLMFTINELDSLSKKGVLIDPVLKTVHEQLLNQYRNNPNIKSAIVVVDKIIDIESTPRDETIYVSSLDIVVICDSIKRGFLHPFSSQGQTFTAYENFVREQVLSGAFIEIIDNQTKVAKRFISMGRTVLEITPKMDPKRESGVYWSTSQHQGREYIHSKPTFMSLEQAEETLGLAKTREEAEGAADAAANFKHRMVEAQNELAKRDIELQTKKSEHADLMHQHAMESSKANQDLANQKLELERLKQDNAVLAARLANEESYRKAHSSVIQNHEAIAADARKAVNEQIETERKNKEAEEKNKRDHKANKKKEHLEERKSKREDTSSIVKFIPAIIAGVFAVGVTVAKIFGWF